MNRDIIFEALSYIPADDRDLWIRMGMAVKSELGDEGFDLWDEWSQTADSYNAPDARAVWKSFNGNGVTIGTLYHEARQGGFRFNGTGMPQPPTAEEIAARERKAREVDAEQAERHEVAAEQAMALLAAATADPTTHPYAVKKRVPLGAQVKRGEWPRRGWNDALLVPIYGIDGQIQSIEAINSDPDETGKFQKDSLLNSKKTGGFHPFGKIRGASRIFIAEGLANGAVAALMSPSVASLGKSNFPHVAKVVRELAPDAETIIVADNDLKPPKKAYEAAEAIGGKVVIPGLDGRKCDLWDVWNEGGLEAVERALAGATPPPMGEARPDTEPPPREALKFSTDELLSAELSPPCIVQDYLYSDVATLIAPGGTGKTTLVLWEAVCIATGHSLYGLDVKRTGWTLIVTAEDQRGIFAARLREILNASDLSDDQKNTAIDYIGVWDVAGLNARLVRMKDGNIDPTRLSDQIISAYQNDPPVMVVFDPQTSFGASEQAVNDNEQALLVAARRIMRELRCCVRFIHHTGKQNARDRTTDQYSGRGGSALPDGSRMVAVLNYWAPDIDKDQPPTGCAATGGSSITVLSRSKLSFSEPNLPKIWIKRTGYTFEYFTEVKRSAEEVSISERDQVEAFLISRLKQGERYTQNDLMAVNEELRLSKHKIRAAIGKLKAQGRVIDADLPNDQKHGAKTKYLHPTAVSLTVSESGEGADTVGENTLKRPKVPCQKNEASITVSAYREITPDTVDSQGVISPFPHCVNHGVTQCDTVDTVGGIPRIFVRCGECARFESNGGGIGECRVEGEGAGKGQPALFPCTERRCKDFFPSP